MNDANVIFVDDEKEILSALKRVTRKLKVNCFFANSGAEALEIMSETPMDVVVSDMRMPNMTGAELLAQVAELYPETIRMVLSGYSDISMVIAAVNEGRIWSYISKPWDDVQLNLTIERALFTQQVIAERALLRRSLAQYTSQQKDHFQGFIGSSIAMQFIYQAIEKAAPSTASVFITGPSGAGKEVAAKAIHDLSKRKNAPFLALNCAAIPSELMESEIFGHVKGAFSGAHSHRDGAATLADGGTLFLDELGEMDMSLQAKLLRFIQTGTFQKVGSSKTEKVNIRFVCATNRDPLAAISEKKLREDLYYRLNVIPIDLPPLGDRDQDALLLAKHFLNKFSQIEDRMVVGFSKSAEALINQYDWPGNVRQLENSIHSAVIMCEGPLVDQDDLERILNIKPNELNLELTDKHQQASKTTEPTSSGSATEADNSPSLIPVATSPDKIIPLAEVERAAIEQALFLCGDNVVKAAGHLGVSPSTLYRKVQSWKTD